MYQRISKSGKNAINSSSGEKDNMTLEKLLEPAIITGTFLAMCGTIYGVSHVTYKIYNKYVLEKLIRGYKEEKKNNKDF